MLGSETSLVTTLFFPNLALIAADNSTPFTERIFKQRIIVTWIFSTNDEENQKR